MEQLFRLGGSAGKKLEGPKIRGVNCDDTTNFQKIHQTSCDCEAKKAMSKRKQVNQEKYRQFT